MTGFKNAAGNAFVYILVAVLLFAALTYTITKINQNSGASDISEGRAEIAAGNIISYAAAAQSALIQLDQMGTSTPDFMLPSDSAFNSGTDHSAKFFHPEGGGFSYRALPQDAIAPGVTNPEPGYFIGEFNNVEWTPTTAMDVIFVAYGVTRPVCEAINKKLLGDKAVIAANASLQTFLIDTTINGGGSNTDLDLGVCSDCEEKAAACVTYDDIYAYYSILNAK